jgi:hypothetical protein
MKRLINTVYILIVFVFCCTCTIGCNNVKAVTKMKYTEWNDETAGISFRTLDSYGSGYGRVFATDKQRKAFFNFDHRGTLLIDLIDEESATISGSIKDRCTIIVEYKNNVLKSTNKNITVFGIEYPQIVFTKKDVDRNTIDASEYIVADWSDVQNRLSFGIGLGSGIMFGLGKAAVGTTEVDIIFVWRSERKFEIYLGNDIEINFGTSAAPAAYGTYVNVQKEATLTFTHDELFNFAHPTLVLTASTLEDRNV